MKFFISIIAIFLFASVSIEAQKIYTMTGSGDTVVNTAVEYVTLPIVSGYDSAVFGVKLTKIDGTVAGTSILQQSLDGTNYETATGTVTIGSDTLTSSNQTTNFKNWWIEKPAFPYWRIMITGSGTMRAKVYGYLHVKKR